MIPTLTIKQHNTLSELRRRIQVVEMAKVVVKATEIFCPVDAIFKATDGNMYYIDGGRSAIEYAIYDDEACIYELDNKIMLDWINENPDRWELDVE
jgi:hypothetical protein